MLDRILTARKPGRPEVATSAIIVAGMSCRLYSPPDASGWLIVFFHGGGFISCGLDTHDEVCRELAAEARVTVVSVEYALAPEEPFPRQITQALLACRWARENAEAMAVAPGQLAVAGDSSGAYMAARAALCLNAEQPDSVKFQLLLYPLTHLERARWSRPAIRHMRPIGRLAAWIIRRHGGSELPPLTDEDLRHAPATLIVSGGADPVAPDARALADALKNAGRPVRALSLPLLPHGGFNLAHISKSARRTLRKVAREAGAMLTETLA